MDFNTVTNIRGDTTRGAAVKGLCGECKTGLAVTSTANGQQQSMESVVMKSNLHNRRGRKKGKIGRDQDLSDGESDMSDMLQCSGDSDNQEEELHFSNPSGPVLIKSRERGKEKSKQNREKKKQDGDRKNLEENVRMVLGSKDGDRVKGDIPVFVMGVMVRHE